MNLNDFFDGTETVLTDVDFYKPEQSTLNDENLYGRCIYLLDNMQITLPSWLLAKIPYSSEISSSKSLWSPMITDAYRKGKSYGKGSLEELKEVLDTLLCTELKNYKERRLFSTFLDSLASGLFSTNVEMPMQDVKGEEIPKFESGFAPLDSIQQGFYQGVFCLAGNPGDGKTSILLYLAKCLAENFPIWYFQTEIPSPLIQARIKKDLQPETWKSGSRFFAGNYSSSAILQKVLKEPNPDRIIIYDSPEIKDSALDKLVYFEKTYQELVQLKLLSKAVFVTSQVKQGLNFDELDVYSLNDSASKARYLDGIIYTSRTGSISMLKIAKNRFGSSRGKTMIKFNMENLTLEHDELTDLFV